MSPARLFVGSMMVLALSSSLPKAAAQEAASEPKITPADTAQCVAENGADWSARIQPGKGRLFRAEAQWPAEVTRIMGLTGSAAVSRELLFDSADRIATAPIPPYRTPEEMVGKGSLLMAKEEGWMRTYGNELVCLSAALKLRPESGKYRTALHDMVLAGCKFETWGRMGDKDQYADMDLAAGHMVRGISIAYDWHRDIFTDEERQAIRDTMTTRVHKLLEGLYGAVFWSNWYSQNHNHVCVAALGLAGAAFYDEIPEAPTWLAGATLDFQRAVRALDADGGTYEGVAYWNYGRAFILQFIEGTRLVAASEKLYDAPSMRNSVAFRVGCAAPNPDGLLIWADSRGHDLGSRAVLYRLASQYHQPEGQFLADRLPPTQDNPDGSFWDLLWDDSSMQAETPTALDYHAAVWDVVTTRSGWGFGDYLFSLKSGRNDDHHTHIDAGALTFNFGGTWLLLAPGYGLGLGQPGFFDQGGARWKFFSAISESHSVLRINGQNQRTDPAARGTIDRFLDGPSSLWTEVDLKQAYNGVDKIRRRILHRRGDYLLILDEVEAKDPATVEWLAQVPPDAVSEGKGLRAEAGAGSLVLSPLGNGAAFAEVQPTAPIVDVSPGRLKSYASKSVGTHVRLATLLQPAFRGRDAAALKTSFDSSDDGSHTRIEGPGWVDEIWIGASEGMPDGIAAEAVALRSKGGKPVSAIAGGATRLRFGQVEIVPSQPADLAVESVTPDVLVLTVGTAMEGGVTLPSGWHLTGDDGRDVAAAGTVSLAPGRYYCLAAATTPTAASLAVTQLFPPTPMPPVFTVASAPELPGLPPSVHVHWEAEENALQQHGIAPVADAQAASGGKALLSVAVDSPDHSVGWKVAVPKDGAYNLKLRYTIGQPHAHCVVLIDGQAPSASALSVPLHGPKGWGEEKQWVVGSRAWTDQILTGDDGVPLRLSLTEGEHEIRIAAPTEAMNLDALDLIGAGSDKKP